MTIPKDAIGVLDKGFVRIPTDKNNKPLILGDDLSIVNAARVSFNKESTKLDDSDIRLLKFLIRNGHMSPFRHAFITLEIKGPLMVARQWFKYIVGSDHTMDGWNEASGRYIQLNEGYVPKEWLSSPDNKKQGSGAPVNEDLNYLLQIKLMNECDRAIDNYQYAIDSGVCVEQARLFLLAYGMYTTWRWSASAQSICHFLAQRLADDAQTEIREYAVAVQELIEPHFGATLKAFKELM